MSERRPVGYPERRARLEVAKGSSLQGRRRGIALALDRRTGWPPYGLAGVRPASPVPPGVMQGKLISGWAGDNGTVTPQWLVRAGWTGWRRELGWVLVALSLVAPCATCGILSGVYLPYQDPTPEMLAQQARDVHQADVVTALVGAIALVCLATGIWLIVWGRRRARRPAQPDS